jgi:hypothetical protein
MPGEEKECKEKEPRENEHLVCVSVEELIVETVV